MTQITQIKPRPFRDVVHVNLRDLPADSSNTDDGAVLGRHGRPRRPELPGGLMNEEHTAVAVVAAHGVLGAQPGAGRARAMRRAWAQLIKGIYEVDPLECPSCGGEIKVVAFITEHEVVDKILRHLKWRGETERVRGPPGTELAAMS